jgi:hypothetical protein
MRGEPSALETHQLWVSGPLRDRLYEHFAALYQHSVDVQVFKDRRFGERRRSRAPLGVERRRGDRRQRRPGWVFPPEPV